MTMGVPRAIDPLARQLALTAIVRPAAKALLKPCGSRRTWRAPRCLTIEEVPASKLAEAVANSDDLAGHWQLSLDRLQAIITEWPAELRGVRNRFDRPPQTPARARATLVGGAAPRFYHRRGHYYRRACVTALCAVCRMADGGVIYPRWLWPM